jgi:hypothetical protein
MQGIILLFHGRELGEDLGQLHQHDVCTNVHENSSFDSEVVTMEKTFHGHNLVSVHCLRKEKRIKMYVVGTFIITLFSLY